MAHTVLLVDDVADLRFLLRVVLESDGAFEVVGEAGDGGTALALCASTKPDVILLDLSMPNMDGLEALPQLRRVAPDAMIVVLSGFEKGRVGVPAAELGADAYFEKGIPPSAVLARLKALLGIDPSGAAVAESTLLSGEELYSIIAHDLRSPLAAILGFGDTLIDRWDHLADDLRRSLVEKMTAQARTLRAIADNLLATRTVDIASLDVELRPVAPAALLTEMADSLAPICDGHPLEVHVAPELPVVLVDRARFLQVLVNLVSNAARHAPPQSPITLIARPDGAWVAVDVCDRGPGIPLAERTHVLEKHVRLSRDTQGLGLGLFVASALCRAMGGSLTVADNDGVGARIVCRLRIAETAG